MPKEATPLLAFSRFITVPVPIEISASFISAVVLISCSIFLDVAYFLRIGIKEKRNQRN